MIWQRAASIVAARNNCGRQLASGLVHGVCHFARKRRECVAIADVEILDEYNLTDWNSNGSGGILMQLLSPSRDEGIFGPKFKVTTPFDPNTGYDAFVVRVPPINLCLFGLPKCGKWIRIYGVAFKKSFELGPASASIDLTVGIFGQYRANWRGGCRSARRRVGR